jgi:hypothetical protein
MQAAPAGKNTRNLEHQEQMMSNEYPLTAIVYDDGAIVAGIAGPIVDGWTRAGYVVCGLIEQHIARPDRRRCDMIVTEIASGERVSISQDRGALARGCMIDADGLLRACALVRQALQDGAQRAMFNKFGKTEAEGGGLRDTIADAISRDVSTIVFIPRRNLDAWRAFAGDFAVEYEAADFLACRAAAQ